MELQYLDGYQPTTHEDRISVIEELHPYGVINEETYSNRYKIYNYVTWPVLYCTGNRDITGGSEGLNNLNLLSREVFIRKAKGKPTKPYVEGTFKMKFI